MSGFAGLSPPGEVVWVRSSRVFDPETGVCAKGAVAVRNERIVDRESCAPSVTMAAPENAILLPGLVDLHGHPGTCGSYSVNPDKHFLERGTTTVLAQGEAGANDWEAYRASTRASSGVRILLAINVSKAGYASPASERKHCIDSLDDIDVDACIAAIHEAEDFVWGISLCTGIAAGAGCAESVDPRGMVERTLHIARATGKPILLGTRMREDVSLDEELQYLRAGDVITYCFHGFPQGLLHDGRVRDCVWEARDRGVLFDVGYGTRSFDFEVAEAAFAQGFLPDTVSTDLHSGHMGRELPHDLAFVSSVMLATGMSETDVFQRTTIAPARVLGLDGELGTLRPGAAADLVALKKRTDSVVFRDPRGATRRGALLEPVFVMRAGEIVDLHQ